MPQNRSSVYHLDKNSILNVQLALRIQTQTDHLDFADGSVERKVYAYANLSYKKDLLVDD